MHFSTQIPIKYLLQTEFLKYVLLKFTYEHKGIIGLLYLQL